MQLSESDFKAVTRESGLASGLPNYAYTSADFFALEQEKLFASTWTCIGNGCSVPRVGDLQPVGFLGQPLLMSRNRHGDIKVFHNVCSHRGNELVWEACHVDKVIQCPYHAWAYDLDGRLLATPNVGGSGVHTIDGLDNNEFGLREARSAVWMDLVFVNLSADAPDFESFIGPLQQRIDRLVAREQFTALKPAATHAWHLYD
jgi:choline monooxygenase